MTIELNRANSPYIFRINPHNPRAIDRRRNVHRGRWEHYSNHESAEAAVAALWAMERGNDEQEQVSE